MKGYYFWFTFLLCVGVIAQNTNTYLGPTEPVPGNPHLVRIQVIVHDNPDPGGVQIKEVRLNATAVPLKPRDIYGFRGEASFQLPPGTYTLKWIVQRDRFIWPRTVTHEEKVKIDPKDLWIQIAITGESAAIS